MHVEVDIINNVGVLRLNRPRVNSLNHDFLQEIVESLCFMESQELIKVVVILSKQPFGFSSGLDLSNFFDRNCPERLADHVYKAVTQVYQINSRILSSEKTFIAALSGPVIGSAASIALACDLRIAARNTWFWLPDPQYGGLLADGGIDLLVKLVGVSRASMLVLTSDRINAEQADKWGLLYGITSVEELEKEALSVADRLSNYSQLTLSMSKKILNSDILGPFQEEKLREVVNSDQPFMRLQSFIRNQ
ncbi:enoyl-CoA hydratase/isomerase family protein [Pelosinus baikalensis]|uniref:Enoyl-CoA hydratase/isomerase family protein n=1 Tax=Pelosinus baikalensis TaxID=2892015 RepID=A0ABS8HV54_9FIRM|nr:enoyl-CoA hydratase/isomerase family protein [Pelosinus baikalensis]